MRVFVAGIVHETSTFSPVPTCRSSFEDFEYHRPLDRTVDEVCRKLNGYGTFVRCAEARGDEVFVSSYAFAQPSAPTRQDDYESLREEILDDLRETGDVDAVLLFLHGAQIAQGYDDCEGDFIQRVRMIVGPRVFVGALLDLHANVSDLMLGEASALVACRNYPHDDFDPRAEHLFDLAIEYVERAVKPIMRFRRIPMLGMFYTTQPQLAEVNQLALDLQQHSDMLSVSLIHGFQFTDVPFIGAGVLTVSRQFDSTVEERTEALCKRFFEARDETRALRKPIEQILDEITEKDNQRPFVIADACDNAGGGAGSDSTFILEEILARGLTGYAVALLWDPVSAQFAADAGADAELSLRLGGKTGRHAGQPLDVKARVLKVTTGLVHSGIGYDCPLGLCVALEIDGNVVIVNDVRQQVFSPSCFTDLGVDLSTCKALVVKSSQHFYDQFASLAEAVFYCETPGLLTLDVNPGHYTRLPRPVWPVDEIREDAW